MKFVLSLFCFIILTQTNHLKAQNYFLLLDSCVSCDFNYAGIDSIDTFSAYVPNRMDSVFNTVSGKYKVYRFIERSIGFDNSYFPDSTAYEVKHQILIMKVDKNNLISDAYTYQLEYDQHPSRCDFYKLVKTKEKFKLESGFYMSNLRFQLQFDEGDCRRDPILVLSAILDNFDCYPGLLEDW